MIQQQKKFIFAYQLLDSTVSEASPLWTIVNETIRTYPNLVAKVKVYNPKFKLIPVTLKIGIVYKYD